MIPQRVVDFLKYFFGYITVWILAVYLFSFLRFFSNGSEVVSPVLLGFDLWNNFLSTTMLGLAVGLMYLLSDFIIKNDGLRKRSYILNILFATVVHSIAFYTTIFFFIIFFVPGIHIGRAEDLIYSVFTSANTWVVFVYFNLVIFILNLERYVRRIFGPGVMIDILKGKYFHPRNEERIFLFLDLVSSTTYAEKLGTFKFTELIQDCFFDVSTIVKKHDAEIYQYVGDEVIITWKTKDGIRKNNAFHFYFSFVGLLEQKSSHYINKFGEIPQFKAGMHMGVASVAEVGEIKKEIAYLGDAVNTASRLLSMCNYYNKKLLTSLQVVNLAQKDDRLSFEFVEERLLKGKHIPTQIYSVERLN